VPSTPGIAAIEADDSLEALLAEHSTVTHGVYLGTLAIVLAAVTAALTSSVDVTVRAPATLRPVVERQTLRAMVDGVVTRVAVSRDETVHVGDTLLLLASAPTERAHEAAESALREQSAISRDLRVLLAADFTTLVDSNQLSLPRTRAMTAEAQVEWRQLSTRVRQSEQVRDRTSQLAQRGFATLAELESSELELSHAKETRSLALERRRAEWAVALADAAQRAALARRDLAREAGDRAAHVLVAPIAGTVDDVAALASGSVVRAGDPIATISPDVALVADVAVSPRDVSHIRPGMAARLLMDGYDVQEWGAADGVVTSVATDYTLAADQPVFRVRVRPMRATLRRPDGRTVALRKGLRCQARFLVGRRRITQLLLRRAGEWADPSQPIAH
jgi:multidrug resistance efflux pump